MGWILGYPEQAEMIFLCYNKNMSLTPKQKKQIETHITQDVWQNIYNTVLTKKQREDQKAMKAIAFDMEEIFQKIAAHFGLAGIG